MRGKLSFPPRMVVDDLLTQLDFQQSQYPLVVILLDLVFGLGVGEHAGRLAFAGTFAPFKTVPDFLSVT